jgi:hypothetical protein
VILQELVPHLETIAFAGSASKQPTGNIPEKLEIRVVSFETASD